MSNFLIRRVGCEGHHSPGDRLVRGIFLSISDSTLAWLGRCTGSGVPLGTSNEVATQSH